MNHLNRRNFLLALGAAGVAFTELHSSAPAKKKTRKNKGVTAQATPQACNPLSNAPCPDGCFCMPRVSVFQCAPTESDWQCCRRYVSDQCAGRGADCKDKWRNHCDETCSTSLTCPAL